MIKYLRQYRFYITLFLFLLIPVIAIDTSTRAAREYRFYDRMILGLTSPIQANIRWSLGLLVSGFENYIYLWHTHNDNLALHEENRKLLNVIANLKETQEENIRLRKMLNFGEQFKLQSVLA